MRPERRWPAPAKECASPMAAYVSRHADGKTRKAFYVDTKLARAVAIRAAEIGIGHSRLIEGLVLSGIGIRGDSPALLSVFCRAEDLADWSIGYSNYEAAAGDSSGKWYYARTRCSLHSRHAGES